MRADVSLSSSSNDAVDVGDRVRCSMPAPHESKSKSSAWSRSAVSRSDFGRNSAASNGKARGVGPAKGSRNWADSRGCALPRGRSSSRRSLSIRSNRSIELQPRLRSRGRSGDSRRSRSRSVLRRRSLHVSRRRELARIEAPKRKACVHGAGHPRKNQEPEREKKNQEGKQHPRHHGSHCVRHRVHSQSLSLDVGHLRVNLSSSSDSHCRLRMHASSQSNDIVHQRRHLSQWRNHHQSLATPTRITRRRRRYKVAGSRRLRRLRNMVLAL